MKVFFNSIKKIFFEALAKNKFLKAWSNRHPRLFLFVKKRLSSKEYFGLRFTIGLFIAFIFFLYFLSLIQDVLASDPITQADIRILNLLVTFRSAGLTRLLLFFTYMGDWQVLASVCLAAVVILGLSRQWRKIYFLLAAVVASELATMVFKLLLHRHRPDLGFFLISQSGYSFPSGHALTSFMLYGLLGYFSFELFKKWRWRAGIILFVLLLVALVGFSRIYLGVHWFSDVLAGWLAAGALLVFSITFYIQKERFFPPPNKGHLARGARLVIAALLVLESGFVFYFYNSRPFPSQITPPVGQTINFTGDFVNMASEDSFPKYSENLVGQRMEPMSLIIVGSKESLISSFERSGWAIADRLNRGSIWRLFISAVFNKSYPTAPITPSFFNTEPEDIAFEKPTAANTVRKRHHVRFWQTNYQLNYQPIWVGTASYDEGLQYVITHSISPAIDLERDFIARNLTSTGSVRSSREIQFVPPMLGKNQAGQQFFTDGKAYILMLE